MKFNKSLSKRVFITVFGALIIVLLISRLCVYYLADDFYYRLKAERMKEQTLAIANVLNSTNNRALIEQEISDQATLLGSIIIVTDKSDSVLYSTITIKGGGQRFNSLRMPGMMRHNYLEKFYYSINESNQISFLNYKHEIENYNIITALPVPALDDTIKAVGRMFDYIIALALLIAAITSVLVARNISKPLLELNTVATELGKLNFDKRYNVKRQDEIGQLGNTINHLAERLHLTIDRLKQELMKERHSEKLRRNFVARASHELQTPLAIINGYTEALQDGVVTSDKEKNEFYQVIKDETLKLSNMVSDLLELSRLENPEFPINKKHFNICELVSDIVKKHLDILDCNKIHYTSPNFTEQIIVYGDKLRLEQAISNILLNAIRHTPEGGTISLTTDKDLDSAEITMFICNTGSHIPEDNLPHVWDSFYTTDLDSKTSGGTGLGLAIAKNIFLRHDCLYGAKNVTDGVCFWFTIQITKRKGA